MTVSTLIVSISIESASPASVKVDSFYREIIIHCRGATICLSCSRSGYGFLDPEELVLERAAAINFLGALERAARELREKIEAEMDKEESDR